MNIKKIKPHSFREFKENFDVIEFDDIIDENFDIEKYSNKEHDEEIGFDTSDILKKFVLKIKFNPKGAEYSTTIFTLIDNEKKIMETAIYIDELHEFRNIFICDLGEMLQIVHHNAENYDDLSNIVYPRKINIVDKEYKKNKHLSLQFPYVSIYILGLITDFLKNRKTIIKNNKCNINNVYNPKIFDNKKNKDIKNIIKLDKEKIVYKVSVVNNIFIKNNDKYNRSISIQSWNVSGHSRHYKNGKVIWIKPYKKGLGETKNKTYIV